VAGGLPVLAMAVLFAGAHVLAALFTMSVVMLALLGRWAPGRAGRPCCAACCAWWCLAR
jgi:hypothetical protein